MSDKIQLIAGLWCTDVLEHLRAYIDGDLDAATRAQVDEHLAGCTWCEHFGGQYAATVRDLRMQRDAEADTDDGFTASVLSRVQQDLPE